MSESADYSIGFDSSWTGAPQVSASHYGVLPDGKVIVIHHHEPHCPGPETVKAMQKFIEDATAESAPKAIQTEPGTIAVKSQHWSTEGVEFAFDAHALEGMVEQLKQEMDKMAEESKKAQAKLYEWASAVQAHHAAVAKAAADRDERLDLAEALHDAVPDMVIHVECPAEGHHGRVIDSVWRQVIHLNDHHRWTRDQIADWLETLDLDLTVRPREGEETP